MSFTSFLIIREIFHGNRWRTDNRFMSPMVKLTDGTSCFVKDCVKVVYPLLGTATGIIQQYFHKVTINI